MYRPKTDRAARFIAAGAIAAGLGIWLAGCSNADLFLDRRDTIALGAGDAVAADKVTQIVDPWPAYSGDKIIAYNGQKMQSAAERYRTGKVTAPADPEDFMSNNQSGQTINQTTVNTGVAPPPVTPGQ